MYLCVLCLLVFFFTSISISLHANTPYSNIYPLTGVTMLFICDVGVLLNYQRKIEWKIFKSTNKDIQSKYVCMLKSNNTKTYLLCNFIGYVCSVVDCKQSERLLREIHLLHYRKRTNLLTKKKLKLLVRKRFCH